MAHFEPYLQLVDVTDGAALIAWGGFRLGSATVGGGRSGPGDGDRRADHHPLG